MAVVEDLYLQLGRDEVAFRAWIVVYEAVSEVG